MKVLLCEFDLFRVVGGGQTFYRSLILRNPHIDFYYFRQAEPEDVVRPANARPIDYEEPYGERPGDQDDVTPPRWAFANYWMVSNLAHSAAGRSFDVIDIPDYRQFGIFVRPAMARFGVEFDRLVLSMHGRMSMTLSLNWQTEGTSEMSLEQMEVLQYNAVDTRYFISEQYRDAWLGQSRYDSYYIDPMWFFSFPERKPYVDRPEPPDLNFIGRTEKCKGPHLFMQLAWWTARPLYRQAWVIGPEHVPQFGESSGTHLQAMNQLRRNDVQFHRCMTRSEMAAVFASKSVTVLPSLFDTLNLTALESLFSGCPTMIGSAAGACGYLRNRFPEIPFEVFDVKNLYANVPRLERVLNDYPRYRAQLETGLSKIDLQPRGMCPVDAYQTPPSYDPAVRIELERWYDQMHDQWALDSHSRQGPRLRLAG